MLAAQSKHGYLPSPIEHLAWGPVEDLTEDGYFFAGTADEVVEQVIRFHERVGGFSNWLAMVQGGDMDLDLVARVASTDGSAVTWGRSTGALSNCLTIELAARTRK